VIVEMRVIEVIGPLLAFYCGASGSAIIPGKRVKFNGWEMQLEKGLNFAEVFWGEVATIFTGADEGEFVMSVFCLDVVTSVENGVIGVVSHDNFGDEFDPKRSVLLLSNALGALEGSRLSRQMLLGLVIPDRATLVQVVSLYENGVVCFTVGAPAFWATLLSEPITLAMEIYCVPRAI